MDPIPYLTVENYHDINYTKVQIPSDPKQNERNAAVYRYTSSNPLFNKSDVFPVPEDYNKTIYAINPTSVGIWMSVQNAPKWRTQLGALYSVTVDGLGNSLLKQIAYNLMVDENFATSEGVKASLWPASDDVSVDVAKAKLMREDKTYGLNNPDNVAKWAALCSIDPNEKIEFQNEIFTYFGLSTITIMEEATNNFCSLVDSTISLLTSACPKMGNRKCEASDFAYWQWSSSYFTKLPALGLNKDSVSQIDTTVGGYPEMSYFKTNLVKKLKGSKYEKTFDKIDFGNPRKGKEYSHLFYIPPKDFVGKLPESSLFNVDTLSYLFDQIEEMPDIFANNTVEVDFQKHENITKMLNLDEDKQTYLLMLWMKKMLEITAMRKDEGGTYFTTNVNGVAAGGLQGAQNWLSREFPAHLYGKLMALSNGNDCEKNIQNYIREIEENQIPYFCNDTKLDLVSTESYAFYVSIYLTRDEEKMNYIYENTGLSEQAMQGLLTPGYYLERNLMTAMKKVKKVYGSTFCKRSVGNFCSNREIGIAQWFNNSISDNPPKPLMPAEDLVDLTGAHHYKPELRTYYERMGKKAPEFSFDKAWEIVSGGAMWGNKFVGDVLLKKQSNDDDLQMFNTPEFLKYTKMLMMQEGMGGLFVEKQVKHYIEGYEDPILKQTKLQMPEEGGDPTLNTWSRIINPDDPVQNSTGCFFVGDDIHDLTRQQCMYSDSQLIRTLYTNTTGIRSSEKAFWDPWKKKLPLEGTDAGAFAPLADSPKPIQMFSSDVMMPVTFDYSSGKNIHGLSAWKYGPDNDLMLNQTEAEENEVFYGEFHGAINVSSVYGAPMFASKGNYLDINYNEPCTPEIYDKEGNRIEATREDDDLYVIVEPWTGTTLSAALRLMLNIQIKNDFLFDNINNVNNSYLFPYVYIKKEYSLTSSQVKEGFGSLMAALTAVLAIRIIGYGLGVILILGGGFLIYWAFKIKKNAGLAVYTKTDSIEEESKEELRKKEPMLDNTNTNQITIDQTMED